MTMAVLSSGHRFHTPCRPDPEKGPRQHHCSPSHASMVESYRLWRWTSLEEAETATVGYATELDEWWETHTRPTFHTYLRDMRRTA